MDPDMQHERGVGHQRTSTEGSGSCDQNGIQRNMCEGLEMPRTSMVEMETAPLERSGERQMVWSTPAAFQNLQVGGHGGDRCFQLYWKRRRLVGISPEQHGMAASCSKPCEMETICEIWKEPHRDVANCLGDPCVCGMATDADGSWWRRMARVASKAGHGVESGRLRETENERFGEPLLPLSLYQTRLDFIWPSTVVSGNGRRSGSWVNRSKDEWFCLKCRIEPWRPGAIWF